MTTPTAPTELEQPRRRGWRSRWAAIGAAVAVSFGAGGIYIGNAASGSAPSSFVAITPVRVLDTRSNLGLTGVFTSPTSRDLLVTGSIDTADGVQTVVPAGVTAVSLNVTVVGPTADGFLSVRPADATGAPTTSSLNFAAGQVIPNAVTVKVPTSGGDAGRIEITYNALGVEGPTTHILVDIVGYYQATAPADGAPCTEGGLPGTIFNGHNSAGETSVTCFHNLVTTLAGQATAGSTDATGIAAKFNNPYGVAVDTAGNIYVADKYNNRVRKITPAGVVTTLAGSGAAGSTDGTGIAAQFNNPFAVAVDAAGNVYVADTGNNRIRKITPAGVVTTLAGSTAGYTDATGGAAQFNNPSGVAVDATGNVYVADTNNNRIRKITPAGVVTTLAGSTAGYNDATGAAAQFNSPFNGVAVDATGNVYVADTNNNRIRKITPAGVVSTLAGSGVAGSTDGTGAGAQFYNPQGVAVDATGNVYVADTNNNRIRKITPVGVVSTLAGSILGYVDSTLAGARFTYASGVAVDSAGNLYVADSGNNRIRKIT